MNKPHRLVWTAGLLALGVVCLFPYTRYVSLRDGRPLPINVPGANGPEQVMANSTNFRIESGFRPIWMESDPLHMEQPGFSFGLGIRWPVFLGMMGIVIVAVIAASRMVKDRRQGSVDPA